MEGDTRVSRYPLTGVGRATIARQWDLVHRAVEVLSEDTRFLAAWLVGSLAVGDADPWSDIDLHCCVADDAVDSLRDGGWKEVVDRMTPTVMATEFHPGALGGYCITPDWVHLDLAPAARSAVEGLERSPFVTRAWCRY